MTHCALTVVYKTKIAIEASTGGETIYMVPNVQVDVSSKPLFNVDEVETIFRQSTASLIGHIFQLIYAAVLDEEKVNRCNGCAIDHPSQTQH